MAIPIVIYHCGQAEYLKTSLKSAKDFNENVILIGDKSNRDYCDNWIDVNSLEDILFERFKSVYKHMASYAPNFDLIMFRKYYVFRKWMEYEQINKAFLIDSDLLTYCDYSKFTFTQYSYAALSTPEKQEPYVWASSPHVSFWTKDAINDFCIFTICMYENYIHILKKKYNYHIEKNIPGGICDMTLLYLWSKNKDNIYNTAIWNKNGVFEHCMGISKNYRDGDFVLNRFIGVKKLIYKKGVPYLITKDQVYIRAYVLHFQGLAKGVMSDYYYGTFNKLIFDRVKFIFKKIKLKIKNLERK